MKTKEEQLVDIFNNFLSTNDIENLTKNLPKLLKSYAKNAKRLDRILSQSDNQQLQVLKLKETLEDTNKKVKILLDNAGEGFLYFDNNMIVGSEYSKEVFNIFKQDVSNKDLTELLYDDISDREFLKSTLIGILNDTPLRQEILISLLQKEFVINGKFIEVQYKVIDDKTFMMILKDITHERELAQKVKDEQQILKMVVEVVTTLEQFIEIKDSYINLILFINDYKSLDKMAELKREIHTFKGLFAQKEMLNIVKELHQFETYIENSIKNNQLDEAIKNITFKDMKEWLDKDIDILKNILGEDIFSKANHISIDKNRLGKLQAKIESFIKEKKIVGDGVDIVLKDIEELKYNNVGTLFRPYEKLVEQLSVRLEKDVNPLVLEGKEIYLNNIYKSFINSLVHIFRNSLDHGIEMPERRLELNKDITGTIKCIVTQDENNTTIKISDDGSGIDTDKVKQKALQKGIISEDEAQKMSEDDLIQLIFRDDFSTSENVTDLSGRGVGLSSVLNELNKLGGELKVQNKRFIGTKFTFILPNSTNSHSDKDLLEKLAQRTISYYSENLSISLEEDYTIKTVDCIDIDEQAITIALTNDMAGKVYMGISKAHAIKLIKEYLDDDMSDEEIDELSIGNLAEILNITLGNILKDLNIVQSGGSVGIEPPETVLADTQITKETNSNILITKLKYQNEEITLGYFI